MPTLNNILLALSLGLETALLLSLLRQGIARRFPAFAVLIAFYLLRSVLLLVLFHRVSLSLYSNIYATLSVLDLLLQASVAWELLSHTLRTRTPLAGISPAGGVSLAGRLALALGLATASALAAWTLARFVPVNPRVPLDRGVLFASTLLLAAGLVCLPRARAWPLLQRVLAGFAAIGLAGLASQTGRALAALHRNHSAFTLWSYVEPTVYLLVLALWLASLHPGRSTPHPLISAA